MESVRRWIRWLVRQGSWRLAILLLPWQIRWFSEGPLVNGYPWEQGRISLYASSIPMLITIGITLIEKVSLRGVNNQKRKYITMWQSSIFFLVIGLVLLSIPSLFTISWRATLQWWMEWLIPIGFFWSLFTLRISIRSIVCWFLLSLVPHLLLGIHQYLTQFVHGSKWLGMATQNSLDRGVSVVQVEDQRILRAYGGFTHPNIFGGWIVIGIMSALWIWESVKKHQQWLLAFFLVLSSVVLVLTFSRSAWIACLFGMIGLFCSVILAYARIHHVCHPERNQVKSKDPEARARLILLVPILIVMLTFSLTAFSQRDKILVRLQPAITRLEVKSLDERQVAIKNGWQLFEQHPWMGTGPGTTILALSQFPLVSPNIPPVPPHVVPLMMLAELGLLGVIALAFVILAYSRTRHFVIPSVTKWNRPSSRAQVEGGIWVAFLFFLPFVPLFFLDHFLWSTWSGKCLITLVTFLLLSKLNSGNGH